MAIMKNGNNSNHTHEKQENSPSPLRCMAVAVVTVALIVLFITTTGNDDFWFVTFILIAVMFFYVSIPIIGLWIYSFIKSIRRRDQTDKVLLYFHIADLLLLGLVIIMAKRPAFNCDADIMADHYDRYGSEMHALAKDTRNILPDSSWLSVEFGGEDYIAETKLLNASQLKDLERALNDVGCIGIEVGKDINTKYTVMRFRRQGMGLYSFILYDRILTKEQQDSINDDISLIVYNDSTVFMYGAGAFGNMNFIGKEEFMHERPIAADK